MKTARFKRFFFCIVLSTLLFISFSVSLEAQERVPDYLRYHFLSQEEMEAQEHFQPRDFTPTDPPPAPVVNIAEFNQMEGVLVRYPFGIPVSLVAEMAEVAMVTTIVQNASQETTVRNMYSSGGVDLDNCNFMYASSDSYWARDYGPWFVLDGNYELGIVNFPYNRPRPNDDDVPIHVADFLGINLFGMNLEHTGGNYMTDGMGISASTDLIWEENSGLSHEDVDQLMNDYLGINTYHVLPDPLADYIKHIDCWGKFLDVDKVLIGQVPESDPRYDDFEYVADYFASQFSSYNKPYDVYRVYTPGDYPNTPYTNSLILNDHVFVPVTGSQWDDEAIAAYEEAMPGYTIHAVSPGSASWENTDALHCRTKGIADREMLVVRHIPYWGSYMELPEYTINADVIPLSGQPLYPDSVRLWYSINGGAYTSIAMTTTNDTSWMGDIPGGPSVDVIDYYISATDQSGKNAKHPFIGEADAHHFTIMPAIEPDIVLNTNAFSLSCYQGETIDTSFIISNGGLASLSFNLESNTAIYEDFDYTLDDSPEGTSWVNNTWEELGWTEVNVTEEGIVGGWQISYSWYTPGYPNGGEFKLMSPQGTVATVAGSSNTGDYIKNLETFNGETMQGLWRLWIEDSYGDGGHEASDIIMTITRIQQTGDWLSINPLSGSLTSGNSITISMGCDATELAPAMYEGQVFISSNDPDEPEITMPVNMEVLALPDIFVNPDSLVYLTYDQMFEGQVTKVYNNNALAVDITNITPEGIFPEGAMWFVDDYFFTFPYTIDAYDSLELLVKMDIAIDVPVGVLLVDTLYIETGHSTHKVAIKVDSDLVQFVDEADASAEKVYPNPFNDITRVMLDVDESEDAVIKLYSLDGSLMYENQRKLVKGHNVLEINTSETAIKTEGIYLLNIIYGNRSFSTSLIYMPE